MNILLPFLGLLAVASAANPKLSSVKTRQSTCINPVSDQEQVFTSNCPKKITVDGNGNCPVVEQLSSIVKGSGCVSYCEAKVQWFFGPEVPYSEAQCQANSTCTFASARSITVTNTYAVNLGLDLGVGDDATAAFMAGASYSWSKSVGTTRTLTQPRPSDSLEYCGYWTFLPYYIKSCGTASETKTLSLHKVYYSVQSCDQSTYTSNDNACNNTPYINSAGDADGVDIFVLTNCSDNSKLPMDQQDVRYQQPGVATSP